MTQPFIIVPPLGPKVPVLLSVPHCGIQFPDDIRDSYHSHLIDKPDDTDWFVHQLYNFASEMGITMIHAIYSRWVIDLNRDPESIPLYNDGRIITNLVPTQTFFGEDLYHEPPNAEEIERRKELYYWPYYRQIESMLHELRKEFDHVLFYDAHSIRSVVPTIRTEPFPDLVLGNQERTTAAAELIDTASEVLEASRYQVQHNDPFKGGKLTRYFGKPETGVHALQLEMSKIHYMDEDNTVYNADKANEMRVVLKEMFAKLIVKLEQL